jgi:hypothetical protein
MRFTLTYDGPLRSKTRAKPADKSAMRAALHPQLERLWQTSPVLQTVLANRTYPMGSTSFRLEKHHSEGLTAQPRTTAIGGLATNNMDLCQPVQVGKALFIPLVRESLSLKCALSVLVLRPVPPGGVLDSGDIDNRLKTLFDALSMPDEQQEKSCPTVTEGPTYTLLQNDRDVVSLEIETKQLLTHPDSETEFVRLIIDVETRIMHARTYNQPFLGD